ncbi:MAG: hypothetical protein E4H01_01005 [Lysobacterales bacterium]|nr:MAG: hypothetical protein E4H01_01005 [Xanthomonadales bacterium]
MKILLHIGQSKTGTSAIQAFLMLNSRRLREAGILYPSVSVGGFNVDFGNHNPVADALAGVSTYPHLTADQYFAQFFETARRFHAERMILSAEHFFGGEPRVWDVPDMETYEARYRRKILALACNLEGHEVSVLVYLRPQVDWLASAVGQAVRLERMIGKTVYENDRQFFESWKPLLRYARLLECWADVLQPHVLTAVPYVREKLYRKSSIADFLRRTELDHLDFPLANSQWDVNQSLTREYIEVKKRLNKQPNSKNVERVTIACLNRLSRQSTMGTSYRLDEDVVRDIEAFVADDNQKLTQDYGGGEHVFVARKAYKGNKLPPLSEGDIEEATALFRRTYRNPRTRLLTVNYAARAFLRRHAPTVHAALHQIKRAFWRMKYRW